MVITLTDVSSLVDEAFESLECAWSGKAPHDGPKAAYLDYHGCWEGWVCATHYRDFVNQLADVRVGIGRGDTCAVCGRIFGSVESYVSVFPL